MKVGVIGASAIMIIEYEIGDVVRYTTKEKRHKLAKIFATRKRICSN